MTIAIKKVKKIKMNPPSSLEGKAKALGDIEEYKNHLNFIEMIEYKFIVCWEALTALELFTLQEFKNESHYDISLMSNWKLDELGCFKKKTVPPRSWLHSYLDIAIRLAENSLIQASLNEASDEFIPDRQEVVPG